MILPFQYQLHTAQTRPECWDALRDSNHLLNKVWPRFLNNDLSQQHFSETILEYSGLRKFQFAIIESDPAEGEMMIACGRSIPFFWPELEDVEDIGGPSAYPHVLHSLPDGGWDTIVSRGIQQYLVRQGLPSSSLPILTKDRENDLITCQTAKRPNALCALSITVRADRRRRGLAERLIEAMRQRAQEECLQALVAPLRPTRKSEFPFTRMENYVKWTHPRPLPNSASVSLSLQVADGSLYSDRGHEASPELPFDPWLRTHIRLGGTVVKVAPSSMIVQGSLAEWQEWTGIELNSLLREMEPKDFRTELGSNLVYLEIPFPGGLVPLRIYVSEGNCIYTEPNVWLYHET